MHFFYIDESGDTGGDLNNPDQPTMVLGGVNLSDEKWNTTHDEFKRIIRRWFGGNVPTGFELHAYDLLSPEGRGYFVGYSMEQRSALALSIINLLPIRKHAVHLVAIDKSKVRTSSCSLNLPYDHSMPYLLAFDYLITYINWYVKTRLGRSARAMILLDQKDEFEADIDRITYNRRFEGAEAHKTKRICEFSYLVDSRKNTMIQFSDLVIYCARRFLEIEHSYHDDWTEDSKKFHAKCYSIIHDGIKRKLLVNRKERGFAGLNNYLESVIIRPLSDWKRRYEIEASGTQIP